MPVSVKEWMTHEPTCIDPQTRAAQALDLMGDRGIRHLPVVDEERRVIGVVSADDLRAALPERPLTAQSARLCATRDARHWPVSRLMTHAPFVVGEDTSLADAAQLMARWRIGCLPVVDDGQMLIGLISETDLLHALCDQLHAEPHRELRERASEIRKLAAALEREHVILKERVRGYSAQIREIAEHMHGEDVDAAERGTDLQELSATDALESTALVRLAAVAQALERVAKGTFGVCEACDQNIPIPRLRALPSATRCVACARSGRP